MRGAVVLVVFLVACTSNAPITISPQPPLIETAAPIAPPSSHRHAAAPATSLPFAPASAEAAAGAISEIRLERNGCRGKCPIYSVDLRKNDVAFYHGVRFATRTGSYKGNIAFSRLAQWIAGEDVFSLEDGYGVNWIDTEHIVLTVASADRTKKIEVGNTASMPPKLYGIVLGIDGLSDRIRWHKAR